MEHLIADRAGAIDASGIRRIFNLAATLKDPINLSIGQPDFPVPEPIRAAAIAAIDTHKNGYTLTQGDPALLTKVIDWLKLDLGWDCAVTGQGKPNQLAPAPAAFITSGTSGALFLAFLALLNPGDECIIPDPYFVCYPHLATMCGAKAITCDTYPDFQLTADRVEPLINDKTKFVLLNTPSNPSGVVLSKEEGEKLRALCKAKGILLISDEIYDEFVFSESLGDTAAGDQSLKRCPSPAREPGAEENTLLIRGFGKTYGCTGWRLGYAAGPAALIDQMAKLQQYTFVCAPSPLQAGVVECFDISMSESVDEYESRRDMVIARLSKLTNVTTPGGAFYAFIQVPESLGLTGTQFAEKCIERELLVIPGGAFSTRDTHFRISFATNRDRLSQGLDILCDLLAGK
ncbi:MAG: aminotransferase class I/II-fold pyridoxal phosphate-dependent enzyme [Phycisphaerales bacterium]|nr:aminotransferase class I/II-fold pyridoxal phosphate-dependent enzyme [Phycisphaerales bacterium]